MKVVAPLFICLSISVYGYSQDLSQSEKIYILDENIARDLNLPDKLIINPNGLIEMSDGSRFNEIVFNHGKIYLKEGDSNEMVELKFKNDGTLKGRLKTDEFNSVVNYSAFVKCSNEDHDPKHLCKLGKDPKDCGETDCVW
ncbi:MAG: hypothetical protein ABJH05_13110 [Fulvivirga sp.]